MPIVILSKVEKTNIPNDQESHCTKITQYPYRRVLHVFCHSPFGTITQ